MNFAVSVCCRMAVLAVAVAFSISTCKSTWAATVISNVTIDTYSGRLELTFRASSSIGGFHRPEIRNGVAIMRFPDATAGPSLAHQLDKAPEGYSLSYEQIRNFALIKCQTPVQPDSATAERLNPNTVKFTVFWSDSKGVVDLPSKNDHWNLDVIVIDPGHGGVDPGAEGVNGVFEKDITLSIGLLLRDLIRKGMPTAKVVMTRETDTFVELYRRGQIANESGGKLFISLHCNSMPKKPHPANGCETYILRPGRSADAARVAARENASITYESSQSRYADLTDEKLIMATLAQSSFVRLSEKFAIAIQNAVTNSTPLVNRGVNQAGFYVLVGASMPNVLVETAFLSNTSDAAYISSAKGQEEVARSLYEAVRSYEIAYRTLLDK